MHDIYQITIPTGADLETTLQTIERQLRKWSIEASFAFDDSVALVLRKVGEVGKVTYEPVEMASLRDAHFTHNHPRGGTLTPQDMRFCVYCDMSQIRAVDGDKVHILARSEAGWGSFWQWEEEMETAKKIVGQQVRKKYIDEGLTNEQASLLYTERMARELSKRLGFQIQEVQL